MIRGRVIPPFFVWNTVGTQPFTENFSESIMNAEIRQALGFISAPIREELIRFESLYQKQFLADPYLKRLFADIPELLRGKRLRPIVFYLSKGLVGGETTQEDEIPGILELLHLASLVHDDVVDASEKRRGNQSLNALWGNRISILAGDYLMSCVLTRAAKSPNPHVYRSVLQTIEAMTRGELRQALGKHDLNPSASQYFEVAEEKTAVLFGTAAELGAAMSSVDNKVRNALRQIGTHFGIAFQIRDDVLDYNGQGERMGKPVGQDFQEGVLTLPAILAFESAATDKKKEFLSRFRKGASDDWPWVQDFVLKYHGVDEALKRAQSHSRQGLTLLDNFAASSYRESMTALIRFESGRTG
jgi:octaprenyl-diphosphate synthase